MIIYKLYLIKNLLKIHKFLTFKVFLNMKSKTALKSLKKAIFIFRRDLRLEDNTGLNACLSASYEVIPCFIFDEKQIKPSKNQYFSNNSVQFMIESLVSLDKNLQSYGSRLFYFYGIYPNIIEDIVKEIKPEAVYLNEDYTPYSLERDKNIAETCKNNGIQYASFHDVTLLEKNKILLSSGDFYKKFTPYYRQACKETIRKPAKLTNSPNFISNSCNFANEFLKAKIPDFYEENKEIFVKGGREQALVLLENVKNLGNYEFSRDYPENQTTNLSAYNKFGCISIRELYYTLKNTLGSKKGEPLLRQLFWRDFYQYILYYYPHVIKGPMKPSYSNIKWENDQMCLEAWKKGNTGVPIVDAGMRSMNVSGYMHNRLRMICSNFLIKVLLIDWRLGEKYFASKLVDYDIAQNNGGWQWSSSTGTDSQPYFRIFNPKLQSQKFDKNCKFILKWIPELKAVMNKEHIHDWESYASLNITKMKIDYPESIVKYKERKEMALDLYKQALSGKYDEDDNTGYDKEDDEGKGKEEVKGEKKKKQKQIIIENDKKIMPSKKNKK